MENFNDIYVKALALIDDEASNGNAQNTANDGD